MADLVQQGTTAKEVWGHPHLTVDGHNLTFHTDRKGRTVPTEIGALHRLDPFSYGGASFIFPGFDPHVDEVGEGRWRMVREHAKVNVRVKRDGIDNPGFDPEMETLYRGNVTAWKVTAHGLEVVCEGRLMHHAHRIAPPRRGLMRRQLLEDFVATVLDGNRGSLNLPLTLDIPRNSDGERSTGIYYTNRSEWGSPVSLVTDALAAGVTEDGAAWTIRYGESGGPVFGPQVPRNAWTVMAFSPGIEVDLTEDLAQRVDVIYGSGRRADGGEWRNTRYPGIGAARELAPHYPAGTTSYLPGDKIPAKVGRPLWRRMRALGYRIESTPTTFRKSDARDLRLVQREAGLEPTGSIDSTVWAAVMSPGMDADRDGPPVILPLAAKPWTQRWIRALDGARIRENPVYDPARVPVTRHVDFGDGVSRREATEIAWRMLQRERNPLISGTITMTADPEEGARWHIREGDQIRVRRWGNRTLTLHISEVTLDPTRQTVSLTVANRLGPFPLLRREADPTHRAAKSVTPAKQASTRTLTSTATAAMWDAESRLGKIESGVLPKDVGSVIRIPVPESGEIVETYLQADAGCEFIAALFEAPVSVAQVEGLTGNPLTAKEGTPRFEKPAYGAARALEDLGLVTWWGSRKSPLGWGFEVKPEESTSDGPQLDGTFRERAALPFSGALRERETRRKHGLDPDASDIERYDLFMVVWPTLPTTMSGELSPVPDPGIEARARGGVDDITGEEAAE